MIYNFHLLQLWLGSSWLAVIAAASPAYGSSQVPLGSDHQCSSRSKYWYEAQNHHGDQRGYAPFTTSHPSRYPVYRNVKDFGAKGNGRTSDSDAIQLALNAIDASGRLNRYEPGGGAWMARPAQIYVPGGTYIIDKSIDFRLNTIMVGDPNDRPIFKAAKGFSSPQMLQGQDFAQPNRVSSGAEPTKEFFMAIKNIIFDTTELGVDTHISAIQWGVSQATQLTNLEFHMPKHTANHYGVGVNGGSLTGFNDLLFRGGNGIMFNNQQASLKGMTFIGCRTAITVGSAKFVSIQGAHFEDCGTAIDSSSGDVGGIVLLDSTMVNTGMGIRMKDSSSENQWHSNQVVIENLRHDGNEKDIIQDVSGKVILEHVQTVDTWIWGNVVEDGAGQWENPLTSVKTPRSDSLLVDNKYFTMAQPTYADWEASDVVNIKSVHGLTVKGDGSTDDSHNLNKILAQNAEHGKLSYFPYGVYAVKNTLMVPAGSRIVGEAWPVIMAIGSAFDDENKPKAVVQVGKEGGDEGVAQISDMRFTVGSIMPGAKILEVNMVGRKPGDVGFWNTHITVGGTKESSVNSAKSCNKDDTSRCKAAWGLVHLTANSGAYIENMWAWVADHGLDPGVKWPNKIAVGRGILVEATKGTWLTGTGSEHNVMYNYNFHNAENVFGSMLQTETSYWQGTAESPSAPAPFTVEGKYGDPDFSWCAADDVHCRMTLGHNIDGGSNIFLYGTGAWAFYSGVPKLCADNDDCVVNHARVTGSPTQLYWYVHDVFRSKTMILDDKSNPRTKDNAAPWGGLIAAYLQFSEL